MKLTIIEHDEFLRGKIRENFIRDRDFDCSMLSCLKEMTSPPDVLIISNQCLLAANDVLFNARHIPITILTINRNAVDFDLNELLRYNISSIVLNPFDYSMLKKQILTQTATLKHRAKINHNLSKIFLQVGIRPNTKGFRYLREAIKLSIEDASLLTNITKLLYPYIAKQFCSTPSRVERDIRTAIDSAFLSGKLNHLNTILGYKVYSIHEKPTNSEFIALLADKLIND